MENIQFFAKKRIVSHKNSAAVSRREELCFESCFHTFFAAKRGVGLIFTCILGDLLRKKLFADIRLAQPFDDDLVHRAVVLKCLDLLVENFFEL